MAFTRGDRDRDALFRAVARGECEAPGTGVRRFPGCEHLSGRRIGDGEFSALHRGRVTEFRLHLDGVSFTPREKIHAVRRGRERQGKKSGKRGGVLQNRFHSKGPL